MSGWSPGATAQLLGSLGSRERPASGRGSVLPRFQIPKSQPVSQTFQHACSWSPQHPVGPWHPCPCEGQGRVRVGPFGNGLHLPRIHCPHVSGHRHRACYLALTGPTPPAQKPQPGRQSPAQCQQHSRNTRPVERAPLAYLVHWGQI